MQGKCDHKIDRDRENVGENAFKYEYLAPGMIATNTFYVTNSTNQKAAESASKSRSIEKEGEASLSFRSFVPHNDHVVTYEYQSTLPQDPAICSLRQGYMPASATPRKIKTATEPPKSLTDYLWAIFDRLWGAHSTNQNLAVSPALHRERLKWLINHNPALNVVVEAQY